jgi:hypothetical protein
MAKAKAKVRYRCPRCRSEEELDVSVLCWAKLDQDNPDNLETDIDTSDQEWDEHSAMRCRSCDYAGKVWMFLLDLVVDPKTLVSEVLEARQVRMYGMDTMLDRIIYHLADSERYHRDPLLRVEDLAGKTFEDICAAKGVAATTAWCLVEAGLIPPRPEP